MRAGPVEEVNAPARLIQTVITRRDTAWLRKVNARKCTKAAWTKVRDIIESGRKRKS